jgi:hypothetical protein
LNLEISLIPYGQVSYVVPGLLSYLQKSELWTRGRANIDDIVGFLYTGQMGLWLVFDTEDKRSYGYIITEIKRYPRCSMLVLQYCAGEDNHMALVQERMYATLERYAKDAGCSGIEAIGRPGWSAHMKKFGYRANAVVFEKYFGDAS